MKKCKFYSEYDSGQHDFGVCHYDEYKYKGFPMICTHKDNEENCTCFEPIKENKNESKNMKKCKFYAEAARRGWCSNVDCLLEKCYFDDNFNSCELFDPIKCEKESSPYRLNSTEINVFSKLFKEYIKDQDKLEKLVEAFESYLSNAVKSPANAEGKCDNEDTLYRIIKERVEDKEESYPFTLKYDRVETTKLMPDNGIDKRALTIQNCDKIILKPKSLEVEIKIEKDNFDDFDFIEINGHKFKKV